MAEAHQLLVEAYNEAALSERTCREWFQKFKNDDFDVEDKDRSEMPKNYEDAELKELLEKDSSQTQNEHELALTLEVTQKAVSHRLKSLEIIHKQAQKPLDTELTLEHPGRRRRWRRRRGRHSREPKLYSKRALNYSRIL
ncbi:Mariner Mos1 transposase [Eumeta japonica]|uniref:Mariner Mos1 transposase n=1 Tax=Eumeta variegata TaxID=151549 RepID=A0A4C1VX17_EUMVA|nr:Mariner Mos1 transposase [Eumeta japonica]